MVIVALIGTWSVLSIYPTTSEVARALLASSAVLAIFAGLALNTPLSNLGSGVLVAFTQPVRLGDRVTVGEHTGFVEAIELIYTTLVTDDERRIFVPNNQLTSTIDRQPHDPRSSAHRDGDGPGPARRPDRAGRGRSCSRPCSPFPEQAAVEVRVTVGDVNERVVWLTATAIRATGRRCPGIGSDLRERALTALAEAELLPV